EARRVRAYGGEASGGRGRPARRRGAGTRHPRRCLQDAGAGRGAEGGGADGARGGRGREPVRAAARGHPGGPGRPAAPAGAGL
ncbi:MAG: hypothetical protein AVDCRST_MAG05-3997, partial [uncultured Rubrobacteraceae bacterium]